MHKTLSNHPPTGYLCFTLRLFTPRQRRIHVRLAPLPPRKRTQSPAVTGWRCCRTNSHAYTQYGEQHQHIDTDIIDTLHEFDGITKPGLVLGRQITPEVTARVYTVCNRQYSTLGSIREHSKVREVDNDVMHGR